MPPLQPEFRLLPTPRGALSNLKPISLPENALKQGEIKVGLVYS